LGLPLFLPCQHPAGTNFDQGNLGCCLQSNSSLHQQPYFRRYYREEGGQILDPYKTLPDSTIASLPFSIREGCGAMQGYREMIVGAGAKCPETKLKLAEMLRAYVTLDTCSQWIIYHHWRERLGIL